MLFNNVTKSRHAVTALHDWYIHSAPINAMIHSASLLSSTGKVTPILKECETAYMATWLGEVLNPPFPWFNTLWLSSVGTFKDKMHTTNPHLLQQRTKKQHLQWHFNNLHRRTPGWTMSHTVVLSAFTQKGKIFSICCITGIFYLLPSPAVKLHKTQHMMKH
jgi:hypothetical protein